VVGVVVDREAGQVERVVVAGLPAGVGRQRAGQLDAMSTRVEVIVFLIDLMRLVNYS
jgi:hypothetical protein